MIEMSYYHIYVHFSKYILHMYIRAYTRALITHLERPLQLECTATVERGTLWRCSQQAHGHGCCGHIGHHGEAAGRAPGYMSITCYYQHTKINISVQTGNNMHMQGVWQKRIIIMSKQYQPTHTYLAKLSTWSAYESHSNASAVLAISASTASAP